MKNVIELIKARREAAKNDGFSLLELVVAVGILLVLTVGGLLAYNGITDNARKAAVDSAASEIYTAGQAYLADNDPSTDMNQAAWEWSQSAADDSNITVTVDNAAGAVKVEHGQLDEADAAERGEGTNYVAPTNPAGAGA